MTATKTNFCHRQRRNFDALKSFIQRCVQHANNCGANYRRVCDGYNVTGVMLCVEPLVNSSRQIIKRFALVRCSGNISQPLRQTSRIYRLKRLERGPTPMTEVALAQLGRIGGIQFESFRSLTCSLFRCRQDMCTLWRSPCNR
jgi:hypothetical protein